MIEDLGTSHTISTNTFLGICCMFRINMCMMKNKIISLHIHDDDSETFYVYDVINKTLTKNPVEKSLLEKSYIIVSSLDKPLKSLTSYKKSELQDIASVFDISFVNNHTKKPKTKQQLYQEIIEQI